jgi:hypothetical protein
LFISPSFVQVDVEASCTLDQRREFLLGARMGVSQPVDRHSIANRPRDDLPAPGSATITVHFVADPLNLADRDGRRIALRKSVANAPPQKLYAAEAPRA